MNLLSIVSDSLSLKQEVSCDIDGCFYFALYQLNTGKGATINLCPTHLRKSKSQTHCEHHDAMECDVDSCNADVEIS